MSFKKLNAPLSIVIVGYISCAHYIPKNYNGIFTDVKNKEQILPHPSVVIVIPYFEKFVLVPDEKFISIDENFIEEIITLENRNLKISVTLNGKTNTKENSLVILYLKDRFLAGYRGEEESSIKRKRFSDFIKLYLYGLKFK